MAEYSCDCLHSNAFKHCLLSSINIHSSDSAVVYVVLWICCSFSEYLAWSLCLVLRAGGKAAHILFAFCSLRERKQPDTSVSGWEVTNTTTYFKEIINEQGSEEVVLWGEHQLPWSREGTLGSCLHAFFLSSPWCQQPRVIYSSLLCWINTGLCFRSLSHDHRLEPSEDDTLHLVSLWQMHLLSLLISIAAQACTSSKMLTPKPSEIPSMLILKGRRKS